MRDPEPPEAQPPSTWQEEVDNFVQIFIDTVTVVVTGDCDHIGPAVVHSPYS